MSKYGNRIAIVGGPRTGKSTHAAEIAKDNPEHAVIHGDDFKYLDWSQQSQAIADEAMSHEKFIVEGAAVARALRKGLKVDSMILMTRAHEPLNIHQKAMERGIMTVLEDCFNTGLLNKVNRVIK